MVAEENVKVAVRVRPFNDREKTRKAGLIIEMRDGKSTAIRDPSNMSAEPKTFAFDFSYWSHDGFKNRADGYMEKDNPKYADQVQVFNDLGRGVLENSWKGYNCSLFAYGQTGSGKSYSMVGYGANKGIVPMVCDELFKQIEEKKGAGVEYQVAVSMLEIYCEKVRDLLDPNGAPKGGLKVREHPKKGFYVENLISAPVSNYKAIEAKIDEGTRNRTVAATQMNATSSRAHTIVQIIFTQKGKNQSGENTTKTSCINLVDLAGSERQTEAGTEGDRLKEGIVINQSLSTLGRCIKALAEQQTKKGKGGGVQVPFRDSVLTSLLKNALGGNSKTVMIAALSPADINYEETLSTLRFADRAKSIKTQAVVNESATDRMIRELREENQRLLAMLQGGGTGGTAGGGVSNEELEILKQQLDKNKKDMEQMEQTWQQRLSEEASRSKAVSPADRAKMDSQRKSMPHFWNLNEDSALTDIIVHFVRSGDMTIGNGKAQPPADIVLNGLSVQKEHAKLKNNDNKRIILTPIAGSRILVNGKEVTSDRELFHNDRVMFGTSHLFVFSHPLDLEKRKKAGQHIDQITYDMAQSEIAENTGIMDFARQSGGAKTKEDMILEEELVRLLPQIYQANAMADELKKNAKFEIVLVAPQARGLKSGPTEIYTKMYNPANDNEFFWDKNKFVNRFYGMQELYQNYMEGYSNWDVAKDRDPFYESPDTEVQIGTVHVFLQSLAYMVEIDEQLPVTDFKGNERGQLKVALMPCSPQGKEITGEFVDQPEELIGKNLNFKVKILNAFGLPRKFVSSRCKYRFYLDDKENSSLEVSGSNPPYGHEKTFSFKPVTKQLVEYLKDQALVIELFGKQSDKNVPGGGRRNVPQAGMGDKAGYKNKADKLEAKLDKIQRLLDEALTSDNKAVSIKAVQQALKEEEMQKQGRNLDDLNGNEGWDGGIDEQAELNGGGKPATKKPKKKRAKSVETKAAAPPSAVSKASKLSEPKEQGASTTNGRKKSVSPGDHSKDKKRGHSISRPR